MSHQLQEPGLHGIGFDVGSGSIYNFHRLKRTFFLKSTCYCGVFIQKNRKPYPVTNSDLMDQSFDDIFTRYTINRSSEKSTVRLAAMPQ